MRKTKIALVGFHLYGGGTARVMANLSDFFYEKDIEVHNIIIHDEIGYEYSGALFNLGKLKSESNTIFNKLKRFIYFRKYVKRHQFDFIIDFRFRKRVLQEYLISRFIYNRQKTIYTIHSSQLEIYLPKSKFWTNVIYGKAYKVLAITNVMLQMIKRRYPKLKNISKIYNPIIRNKIIEKSNESINLDFDFIIGVGQFDTNQKQFDKLIEAYAKSKLPKNNILLVILGKGKRKEELELAVKNNNVEESVCFLGFKTNPYKYMKQAMFFTLSSWHEGHPMVLIEALSCSTPVIAFDCPTGPREVIKNRENGLLIENQNLNDMVRGFNLMFEDKKLYSHCKQNTLNSVKKFDIGTIGQQWLDLMNFNN